MTAASPQPAPSAAPGVVIITTLGSRWEFWETEHLYRRSPLTEAGRERPEWGGPEAGPLQDHVWHPFVRWAIRDYGLFQKLHILLPDGSLIRAPEPDALAPLQHQCITCDSESAPPDEPTK